MKPIVHGSDQIHRLERLRDHHAVEDWEITYHCHLCRDTGFVLADRPGPQSVYGQGADHTATYGRRCDCKGPSKPKPIEPDDLPI